MFREAHATWKGGPFTGKGTVSTPSGSLSAASYVFGLAATGANTTPGELLAAAVASSMSTVVARKMANLGARPVAVDTHALLTVQSSGENWKITALHLEIRAQTLDPDVDCLEEAVEAARRDCPVSSELNLSVTCSAKLIPLTEPLVA